MKFVLAKSTRYWWPVTVLAPDPDQPGKFISQQLKIQFTPKDQDAALEEQRRTLRIADIADRIEAERKALCDVCTNWDDVIGDDGNPVPFTPENLDLAMRQSWFRSGVYAAYMDSLAGQEARLGN